MPSSISRGSRHSRPSAVGVRLSRPPSSPLRRLAVLYPASLLLSRSVVLWRIGLWLLLWSCSCAERVSVAYRTDSTASFGFACTMTSISSPSWPPVRLGGPLRSCMLPVLPLLVPRLCPCAAACVVPCCGCCCLSPPTLRASSFLLLAPLVLWPASTRCGPCSAWCPLPPLFAGPLPPLPRPRTRLPPPLCPPSSCSPVLRLGPWGSGLGGIAYGSLLTSVLASSSRSVFVLLLP